MDYYLFKDMIEKFSEILGLDIRKKTRKREYVWARFAVFYFLQKQGVERREIEEYFGFSRATVIYGLKVFEEKFNDGDPIAIRFLGKIQQAFKNGLLW